MSAFLLFAAIAFLVYELIAFAQLPRSGVSPIRWGGLTINFDAATARRWRLGLRILIFFLILTAVLLLHQFGSGTILGNIWANRAAIILGLFFGALFAMWINSVFTHTAGDALTKGQVVAGIGLIVLFIVGSAGNDFSTLIQQISRKISTIKVGGAEIALQGSRKTPATALAVAPTHGAVGSRVLASSAGLELLAGLDEAIGRDCGYIALSYSDPLPRNCAGDTELDKKLGAAKRLATLIISGYAHCLNSIYAETGDTLLVNAGLSAFAPLLRELSGPKLDVEKFSERAAQALYQETAHLVTYPLAKLREIEPCVRLMRQFASAETPFPTSYDGAHAQSSGRLQSTIRALLEPADGSAFLEGPYAVVAYAELMAKLGYYQAALQQLYRWIHSHENKYKAELGVPSTLQPDKIYLAWFGFRARSNLAFFTEEWIRSQPSVSTLVRDEHLDNLKKLIDLMTQIDSSKKVVEFLQKPTNDLAKEEFRRFPEEAPSSCRYDDTLKQQLVTVYLYNTLIYSYNAIHHPRYDSDLAEDTKVRIAGVMNADMSCVAKYRSESPETYDDYLGLRADALDLEAQALLRETMNKRRQAINEGREYKREEALENLYRAQAAATLAHKRIEPRYHALTDGRRNAEGFIERTSPSSIFDSYESLDTTRASISDAIEQVKND